MPLNPDLVFCLNRHQFACCISRKIGYLYGVQTGRDNRYGCGNCKVDFIDIDFKNPDIRKHDEIVLHFKPKYATILDITDEPQIDMAIMTAGWYYGHGIQPIVIPKIDCINDISGEYILGFSVPSKYGKTGVNIEKFNGRKIHLLGGTPKQQLQYYKFFSTRDCKITSLDGNCINHAAQYGKIWVDNELHQWEIVNRNWEYCIAKSLENIWNFWSEVFTGRRNNQICMW